MRISDWSSDVCSSDLFLRPDVVPLRPLELAPIQQDAPEDELGGAVGFVQGHGAAGIFESLALLLRPAIPGQAAPLIEMGQGEARIGAGELRVDLQRAFEEP